jgi:hypothetical protein
MEQATQLLQRLIGYGVVVLLFAGMFYLWWQGLRLGKRWQEKVHGSGESPLSIFPKKDDN